jgi:acetoin utilization deacetylase AcuC-like enzyme
MSMPVFHNGAHRLHSPKGELHGGELVRPFERPERVDFVLEALALAGFDALHDDSPMDEASVRAIHDADYLAFLHGAWDEWRAAGYAGDIIPTAFPARRMAQRVPNDIDGKAGYYTFAAETAITAGTWTAATASCALAQRAAGAVSAGAGAAFAVCRPPGHHASSDYYGGYCFLNNAAVAAQCLLDNGARQVAVVDVDFHHGNGTQDIFYERNDVLFCSLHGQPQDAFPFFSGFADEKGSGSGLGATANFPLPPGTHYSEWSAALGEALARVRRHGAQAMVISLGVDTFKDDPISFFKLETEDYLRCGALLATANLPTVFVLEGGYAVEQIGTNAVNVLTGFCEGQTK